MNYFEFYPGDYLRDTTSLNLTEHGAYLRLLIAYYSDEKPLPKDVKTLYLITSAISAADKAATRKVAEMFFPVCEDGFRHKNRVDEEIAKAQKRIKIAQENGSRGGRKPNPVGNPLGNPAGNPAGSSTDTQWDTQRPTQPGEALHTPHAIHQQEQFEARTSIPTAQPTEAGRACLLLKQAGCARVNPSHPELLAALSEGVSPEAIRDTYLESPGKANPFAYAISTARSRHAQGPKAISTGPPPSHRAPQISKTGMAVQALEAMKSENRLGTGRDSDGPAEAGLPRLGSTTSG